MENNQQNGGNTPNSTDKTTNAKKTLSIKEMVRLRGGARPRRWS